MSSFSSSVNSRGSEGPLQLMADSRLGEKGIILVSQQRAESGGLHVSDDGAVSDDGQLLHPHPAHHRHAGHAGSLAPHWGKVEPVVVQLLLGVGRHLPLHQSGELTDVEAALAEPGKDPWRKHFSFSMIVSISGYFTGVVSVGIVSIIPGPSWSNPDDGGAVVDVGRQGGVLLPVSLSDPLALHHHLLVGLHN